MTGTTLQWQCCQKLPNPNQRLRGLSSLDWSSCALVTQPNIHCTPTQGSTRFPHVDDSIMPNVCNSNFSSIILSAAQSEVPFQSLVSVFHYKTQSLWCFQPSKMDMTHQILWNVGACHCHCIQAEVFRRTFGWIEGSGVIVCPISFLFPLSNSSLLTYLSWSILLTPEADLLSLLRSGHDKSIMLACPKSIHEWNMMKWPWRLSVANQELKVPWELHAMVNI